MNHAPLAIAFDLDDTLYREADYVDACLRNVAAALPDPAGAYEAMSGTADPYRALTETFPGCGMSLERFLEIYRSTAPASLPLRPDARRLLDILTERGIPIYLITDGRPEGQRNKIKALGLDGIFAPDHIIVSGETGYDKRTPMPFAIAMMREDAPRRWIYVGDNPAKDFRWPNLMGWDTVMLLSPRGTTVHSQALSPEPTEYTPRRIITSLDQLPPHAAL